MAMDQYTHKNTIFRGLFTSTNPSYFDVNYRGTIGFDTLPYESFFFRTKKTTARSCKVSLWKYEEDAAASVVKNNKNTNKVLHMDRVSPKFLILWWNMLGYWISELISFTN